MQRRVRKSGRFALCLAVTFGMATGGNVIAQRASPPEGVSGLRLGALLVAPSVELTNVGLDTNILRETDQPKRDVVGTTEIGRSVTAQGGGLDAIAAAFDDALGKVLKRLVEWTLVTGQAARKGR